MVATQASLPIIFICFRATALLLGNLKRTAKMVFTVVSALMTERR